MTERSDTVQINPGSLDKKIEIVKYELQKDPDGFETKTEIVVLRTWAQVTNISGTEILRSNSDFSKVKTRFLMRTPKVATKPSARMGTPYEQSECGGINKDMYIKFSGNVYNIVYINDYSYDKKYTEIIAELVIK